jgi:uncharacterized protein YodC (DUF2158 family)
LTQSKLTAGDLVRAKSGGPIMTAERVIDDIEEPYARCIWFDAHQRAQCVSYKTAALELVPRST